MPVNFVSFWDGLRFANWLHNGQPTGAQGNSTTEDGAYTLTAGGITVCAASASIPAAFTALDLAVKSPEQDTSSLPPRRGSRA